jgi:hypothetical protein
VLALAAVGTVVVATGGDDGDRPASAPDIGTGPDGRLTRADWTGTATGVFRGTSAQEVAEYEQWLGSPVDHVVDFPAYANWYDISSPDYLLEEWQASGRRLVLSLPMLPTDVAGVSLQAGAAGEYDEYFRTLGEKLVSYDLQDVILRPGWEFDLETSSWHATDPAVFIEYWRRIVAAMTSAPGQEFRFAWNPNNGPAGAVDAADFYPGGDVVDYVAVDVYDVAGAPGTYPIPDDCTGECATDRHRTVWNGFVYGGDRGLRFWSQFAERQDKPMALPEWGVWEHTDGIGGGDDPYFIERMHEFITDPDNRVAFHGYFEDTNSQGTHRLQEGGLFPEASARYRELFGG